jgi:rfaE bifunctional protein kinase chain/domain/rfaE bifunctional protein nucleotidyltransferase chain/domain
MDHAMFNAQLAKKIKTVNEIIDIGSEIKRSKKKSILCHGVFDVVHPGHLRHLEFAKSQADILIVSVTADRFIKKGVYRPHVSEILRARQLAHLSIVDYVIINEVETPEVLIRSLKPDFFAKGFEYVENGLPPATQSESEAVKSYGGRIIFTPGDIVYSSSNLIGISEPNLSWEKIQIAMTAGGFEWQDILSYCRPYPGMKVTVLGDLIVDTLIDTSMYGISSKTPTLSVIENGRQSFVGGAGIVALHFAKAGAQVKLVTLTGRDTLGSWAVESLISQGVEVAQFEEEGRPTTEKAAFVNGTYRLLKVDRVDNRPISMKTQTAIYKELTADEDNQVFVFSDFRHGIFNKNSIEYLVQSLRTDSFNVADSQVASRWGNITEFKNFDLITPNEKEARFSLGDQDSTINRLAINLMRSTNSKNLILKLGHRGILSASKNTEGSSGEGITKFGFNSFATNVVDAVGSGDALLAYATLALAEGAPLPIASIIGNAAAGLECGQNGNVPLTPLMIGELLENMKKSFDYSVAH